MAAAPTDPVEWVRQFSDRVREFVRDEAPESLVEFVVEHDDCLALLRHVGQLPLEWVDTRRTRPAVAVAAVQAAAEAQQGDDAFRAFFFQRIQKPLNLVEWEVRYGAAIEAFLNEAFAELPRPGPGRYVNAIYRHSGVPLPGIRAYAYFLDQLAPGPDFTRRDYDDYLDGVTSSLIRPFLSTNAGLQFTRATVAFLRRHGAPKWDMEALDRLRGYRPGFWHELKAHLTVGIRPAVSVRPPLPVLALDLERWCLVVRFDVHWQRRGAYAVDGRRVPYADQRVAGTNPMRCSVQGSPSEVRPWWGPGQTTVAVFRVGDGVLLGAATPGGSQDWTLRGGSHYIVAGASVHDELSEIGAEHLSWLDVLPQDDEQPSYEVWLADLEGNTAYPQLGLRTTGSAQLPFLRFEESRPVGGFGQRVFRGELPRVLLGHWTADSAARFAIWQDDGHRQVELSAAAAAEWVQVQAEAPCQGRVWIEPRGYSTLAASLPSLDFVLLPEVVSVRVEEHAVGPEDYAHVDLAAPAGWSLQPAASDSVQVSPGRWQITGRRSVFEGSLCGPGIETPVSLRLPVVQLSPRGGEKVVWLDLLDAGDEVPCDLTGPAGASVEVLFGDESDRVSVGPRLALDTRGYARKNLRGYVDALANCRRAAGRLVVRAAGKEFEQQVWVVSARHLSDGLSPVGRADSGGMGGAWPGDIPDIGPAVSVLVGLSVAPVPVIEVASLLDTISRSRLPAERGKALRMAILETVALASAIDGVRHDLGVADDWIREIPELDRLAGWFLRGGPAPDPFPILRAPRWRKMVEARRTSEDEDRQAADLVGEWREAVRHGGRSRLAGRPGGGVLSAAALSYGEALLNLNTQLRNQALSHVVATARQAQAESQEGTVVFALAFVLEQLAKLRSGRRIDAVQLRSFQWPAAFGPAASQLERIAGLELPSTERTGLCLSELSPSEADVFEDEDV